MIAMSPTSPMTMPTIAPLLSFEEEGLGEENVLIDPAMVMVLVLDWVDCPPDVVDVGVLD
jgi:hypothetical protein